MLDHGIILSRLTGAAIAVATRRESTVTTFMLFDS